MAVFSIFESLLNFSWLVFMHKTIFCEKIKLPWPSYLKFKPFTKYLVFGIKRRKMSESVTKSNSLILRPKSSSLWQIRPKSCFLAQTERLPLQKTRFLSWYPAQSRLSKDPQVANYWISELFNHTQTFDRLNGLNLFLSDRP
mgnify:CR=1 FL=1